MHILDICYGVVSSGVRGWGRVVNVMLAKHFTKKYGFLVYLK